MLHTTAGCDLSLSKVFISFYEEEGGQESIVIIFKISLLQKKWRKLFKQLQKHIKGKSETLDYLPLWNTILSLEYASGIFYSKRKNRLNYTILELFFFFSNIDFSFDK